VSFLAERTAFPAEGINGGKTGAPGVLKINGEVADTKSQYLLNKGDTVFMAIPGGGGYGDPAKRSAGAHAMDLAAGYVTANS
jgi:N-methylhydantoinase B